MVSDGAFLILAGLTSWGALQCAKPNSPGVYTRLGAPALNDWVRGLVPMARATVSDAAVDPDDSRSRSRSPRTTPASPDFTAFAWDFDSDGTPDATGSPVSHAYPAGGLFIARVVARRGQTRHRDSQGRRPGRRADADADAHPGADARPPRPSRPRLPSRRARRPQPRSLLPRAPWRVSAWRPSS